MQWPDFVSKIVYFFLIFSVLYFCSYETFRGAQYGQAPIGAQHRATISILQGSHTRVSHQSGHRLHKRNNEPTWSERGQRHGRGETRDIETYLDCFDSTEYNDLQSRNIGMEREERIRKDHDGIYKMDFRIRFLYARICNIEKIRHEEIKDRMRNKSHKVWGKGIK